MCCANKFNEIVLNGAINGRLPHCSAHIQKRRAIGNGAHLGQGHSAGPVENLRELVKHLGVEEHVHFLGFHQRDDLVELYTCADVFCLPSRHEPWGVVVNEAAACGLPLVVSDRVGAGRDLVTAGENGRVVPVEDAEALKAAIHGVLNGWESADGRNEVSRSVARKWSYDFAQAEFRSLVEDLMRKLVQT